MQYEVRYSPRRRTLSVEVHADYRVIVRAPTRADRGVIDAWVAERGLWIERQFERFRRMGHERPAPLRHVPGEAHLFLGERYRLQVHAASRAAVALAGDALRVAVRGGAEGEPVRRALERWYRERAAELFPQLVLERFDWFAARGHVPPTLSIRSMTTRWGSLSGPRRGGWFRARSAEPRRMTLNLALIRAPRECIEYVVVHELCHLEQRGHGRGFYGLMDQRLPDWRERKRRLEASLVLAGGTASIGDSSLISLRKEDE